MAAFPWHFHLGYRLGQYTLTDRPAEPIQRARPSVRPQSQDHFAVESSVSQRGWLLGSLGYKIHASLNGNPPRRPHCRSLCARCGCVPRVTGSLGGSRRLGASVGDRWRADHPDRAGPHRSGQPRGAWYGVSGAPFVGFCRRGLCRPEQVGGSTRVQRGTVRAALRVCVIAAGELLRRAVPDAARGRGQWHTAGVWIQCRGGASHHQIRSERSAQGVVRPVSHAGQLVEHRVSPRTMAADHHQPAGDGPVRRDIHSGALRRCAGRRSFSGRRLESQLPGWPWQRPRERE